MPILVRFIGVCTHVRRVAGVSDWLPVQRRVVLANSRTPWRLHEIPQHYPMVRMRKKFVTGPDPLPDLPWFARYDADGGDYYAWDLHGAMLSLRGVGGEYQEASSECMPPTLETFRGFRVRPDLVGGVAPNLRDWFDGFFDFDAGTVTGCCNGVSYGVRIELTTTNDVIPQLVVLPFAGATAGMSTLDGEVTIDLTQDAEIEVKNDSLSNTGDDKRHFALHYMIGGTVPPDDTKFPPLPPCPRSKCGTCSKEGPSQSLGVGCSSSNWP